MFKPLIVTFGLMLGVQAWAAEPANEPILAVQPAKISDPKKVELGKQLFFDPRLSKSGFISCNSCHNLSLGGSDNLPTSIGHNWHQGPINSPFKVPTLRNVELTYPYFHDGAYWNLEEAVEVMARLQLGRKLKPEEISQMVAFLKTLTGDQPDFKLPILPPSSAQTPRLVPFDQ